MEYFYIAVFKNLGKIQYLLFISSASKLLCSRFNYLHTKLECIILKAMFYFSLFCRKRVLDMSSSATTNENSTFLSFVPKDDIDLSGYKEAIDYALNTDKIRNIAISGPYGSGKSSIVESYEKANPDKKIIHISLARFNDISCEDSDEVKADDTPAPSAENSDSSNKDAATASSISDEAMVNLLEGKILNQLIHLISPDVVLNSGFRINSNDKKISFQYPVLFLCIFTFFAIYAAKFSSWCSYIESIQHPEIASILNFSTSTTFRLFAIALCILASAYALYKGLDYIFNEKRYKNRITVSVN